MSRVSFFAFNTVFIKKKGGLLVPAVFYLSESVAPSATDINEVSKRWTSLCRRF